YKGVLRADDDASYSIPTDAPAMQVVVRDPEGQLLGTYDVVTNAQGTFAGEVPLPDEAAIGRYQVSFERKSTIARWKWIAGTSFAVAEFRRPEFEVAVTPARDHYINGETIEVEAGAQFYFGGPV